MPDPRLSPTCLTRPTRPTRLIRRPRYAVPRRSTTMISRARIGTTAVLAAAVGLAATAGSDLVAQSGALGQASRGPVSAPAPASSSAQPLADSCGVAPPGTPAPAPPAGRGGRGTPVFPAGAYPVTLPAASLLGARNDLPNPYRAGIHW